MAESPHPMMPPAARTPASLGLHLLIDLEGCDPRLLDDLEHARRTMLAAAAAARSTIVDSLFHRFSPQGVSGVVVIAESHLAIHTWPEHGLASIDIYTSGPRAEPRLAVPVLELGFGASKVRITEIERCRRS